MYLKIRTGNAKGVGDLRSGKSLSSRDLNLRDPEAVRVVITTHRDHVSGTQLVCVPQTSVQLFEPFTRPPPRAWFVVLRR